MRKLLTLTLAAAGLALLSGAALADAGGIPNLGNSEKTKGWTLTSNYDTATNTANIQLNIDNPEALTGTEVYTATWGNETDSSQWIDLGGGAKLCQLVLGLDGDPQVNLSFSVIAGLSDTTFNITSSLLTFATIDPAQGRATAGITVSDYGGTDGVTATGLFDAGKLYQARFNNTSVFTDLVSGPVVTSEGGGSTTGSQSYPGGGLYTGMGSVSNMQSQFKFVLSAYDGASTTSSYRIQQTPVPEPASILALTSGLACIAGVSIRRRRR